MTTVAINTTANKSLSQPTQVLTPKPLVAAVKASVVSTAKPAEKSMSSTVVSIGKPATAALGLYSSSGTTETAPAKKIESAKDTAPTTQPDALALAAGGVTAGSGHVVVDIKASDSGYDNKIYYSTDNFKTKQYIGVDNQTGSVDLGTFKPGTTIQFGIDNGQGQFFKAGPAASNTDNFQHSKSAQTSSGVQIGFEDLNGGGDQDFNDAIINVRNVPVAAASSPALAATPTPSVLSQAAQNAVKPATAAPAKDNKSGLGDGTNPGQGGGKINSPNEGTNNPAAVKAPVAIPVTAQPVSKSPPPAPVKKESEAPKADDVAAKKAADLKASADAAAAKQVLDTAASKKAADLKTAADVTAKAAAAKQVVDAANAKKVADAAKVAAAVKPAASVTPTKPAVVAAPITVKDNRSGLGDGTNPGHGAGTTNSPNTGTLNPGGLKKA
jgi:hypothetical protein